MDNTLNPAYIESLDAIKDKISNSEILTRYLDEEDEEIYKELLAAFEPEIDALHAKVISENPLQIIAFENQLLDEQFEGLYLPRILGYAVMRGQINDDFKYIRPQNHFRDILLAIANSANFEVIKNRIGQTVQVGLFLSSNIWTTNLIKSIRNKKVANFLDGLRLTKFRDVRDRRTAYIRYKRQFDNFDYETATFPDTVGELKVVYPALQDFLIKRNRVDYNNDSLMPALIAFVENPKLANEYEYKRLLLLILAYFPAKNDMHLAATTAFEKFRKTPTFETDFFTIMDDIQTDKALGYNAENDQNLLNSITYNDDSKFSEYMQLLEEIHSKGYVHEEVIDAVRTAYNMNPGTSEINACIRNTILTYIKNFISNLTEPEYTAMFDIYKTAIVYMGIFSNEYFNQDIKNTSLAYIKKLIKHFTDRRGKDYQDIKKFVKATFVDLGFLTQKEVTELFKNKRKKKVVA